MSYRYMRIIVLFDLPVITTADRRNYTRFRKYLIKNGFLMMQESVYCRLAQNQAAADYIISNIRKNKPASGTVQVIKITEKQYSRIETIVGKINSDVEDSDERLLIL